MPPNAVRYLKTGSDDLDLGLKIYKGMFADTWRNMAKLFTSGLPVIHRTTVSGAKSYQNLLFADIPAPEEDYLPGPELLGQDYATIEKVVTRDNYVIAHKTLPRDLFTSTAHFDILSRLGRAHARHIGLVIDKRLFITACLAARAASETKNGLTVHSGGNRVTRTGGTVAAAFPKSATGAANFTANVRDLAGMMDVDNIPPDGRYMWLDPYLREVMQYDTTGTLWSGDYQPLTVNNIQMRAIGRIAGFIIVDYVNTTSNGGSLPNQNITTGPSKYQGNFTAQASDGIPVAVALCEGPDGSAAVSMGTWEGVVNTFGDYQDRNLTYFASSFILAGIGQMLPSCAGSIEVIT